MKLLFCITMSVCLIIGSVLVHSYIETHTIEESFWFGCFSAVLFNVLYGISSFLNYLFGIKE